MTLRPLFPGKTEGS
jgi:serine/threonine protein kinase